MTLPTTLGTIAAVTLLVPILIAGCMAYLGVWVISAKPIPEELIVKNAIIRPQSNSGEFTPAAPLCAELSSHSAYLLQDGKVLLTGLDSRNERQVQLFDPRSDSITIAPKEYWVDITKSAAGVMHIGGHELVDTAELRESLKFRSLAQTSILKKWYPDIVVLSNKQILLAGGATKGKDLMGHCIDTTKKVGLYDESAKKYMPVGPLGVDRGNAAPVVLQDGRVLFTGGDQVDPKAPKPKDPRELRAVAYLRSTEMYNPSTRRFTNGPLMNIARTLHSAILLADGRVLVIGGLSGIQDKSDFTQTAEIYDPKTNTFGPLIAMSTWHLRCQTLMLPSGNVLVMGEGHFASDKAELFDAARDKFLSKPMILPRWLQTATVLQDGRVLVAGGLRKLAILSDDQELYAKLHSLTKVAGESQFNLAGESSCLN